MNSTMFRLRYVILTSVLVAGTCHAGDLTASNIVLETARPSISFNDTLNSSSINLNSWDSGAGPYLLFQSLSGNNPTLFGWAVNADATDPAYIMQLSGGITGTGAQLELFKSREFFAAGAKVRLSANGNSFFNGGNVGVGTQNPQAKVDVAGGIRATGLTLMGTSGVTVTLSANGYTIFSGGNVGIGRTPLVNKLEVEGSASKSTATAWLANSDRRIKTEIRPVTQALATLERVRPVSFRYSAEYRAFHKDIADREYVNVIAQEFADVFPDAVQGSGERLPGGAEILQVDTYPATITAIAAIKELNAELKTVRKQCEALANRVAELERKDRKVADITE